MKATNAIHTNMNNVILSNEMPYLLVFPYRLV